MAGTEQPVEAEQEGSPDQDEGAVQELPAQSSGRYSRTNDILGKGAFKTVYKGFDEEEGIEVAWNQIRMSELVSTKEDRERLFAEIRVLKQLKHKNIMTFYDSWLENKGYTVNFITELFTSGTLRQYRKRHKQMDPEVMKRWAWQILCGLVYLHGHTPPIIHRDLKCDNIFINGSEGVVKIGDLGLATMLRARTAPQSVLGTPEFMAPELYDEEYDDRVDVYSFGMCLLELATLEYPYSECRNAAQIYRKVTLGVRPKALSRVPTKELAEFISHCIQPKAERPRSRQLLKHPYFDSIRAERCTLKLSAEALGVPQDALERAPGSALSQADLQEYANSAGSSSVSRTSSAAGELHNDGNLLLDAVPEEDEPEEGSSVCGGSAEAKDVEVPPAGFPEASRHADGEEPAAKLLRAGDATSTENLRDFKVKGRLQEDEDKLNLRLRIQQPDRAAKVVEFDFDLASDTAMSVASEMVEEMSLSHTDAHRIAIAIREEIFNLTHKMQYCTEQAGSGSDEDNAGRRQALISDNGQAEHTAATKPDTTRSLQQQASFRQGHANGACSDSVMSVQDMHQDPSSPGQQAAQQPKLPLRVVSHPVMSSPPDSHISYGSSPAAEPMMIDAAPLQQPALSAPAWRLSTSLPPHSAAGLNKSASEGIMARLSRTDSANQTHEVEALQQALVRQSSGSGRILFALPKEEDRRLPLKKLLENLQEVDFQPPTSSFAQASREPIGQRVPHTEPATNESSDDHQQQLTPRSASTSAVNAIRYNTGKPDLRRMSHDSGLATASSPHTASTSGRQLLPPEGVTPFPGAAMQVSRTSSPRQEALAAPPGSAALDAASMGLRSKSKADLAEAKELRRQAAQTSLKNMESKSLEGLDTFGLSRGCKQVSVKNLMGWGKS